MSFLTPQVFDILVYGVIILGLIAAAIRIRHDFRSGPRWPDNAPGDQSGAEPSTTGETNDD